MEKDETAREKLGAQNYILGEENAGRGVDGEGARRGRKLSVRPGEARRNGRARGGGGWKIVYTRDGEGEEGDGDGEVSC